MGTKEERNKAILRQQEITSKAKAENRDLTPAEQTEFDNLQRSIDSLTAKLAAEEKEANEKAAKEAMENERKRASEITEMCRDFEIDPSEYIKSGKTVDEVRAAVMEELKKQHAPLPARGTGEAQVTADEEDKFRAAVSDGLLMRGGIGVANPAEGARNFRGTSLKDIVVLTAQRSGKSVNDLIGMDPSDVFNKVMSDRAFYNPTAAFPSILDTAINKAYVEGHRTASVTFDKFTKKGSLKDFKTDDHRYLAGPAEDFLLVPEGGELKHSTPTDKLGPTRKLRTYGRQFTMTREAFINDDIGFLSKTPSRYAGAARRTLNKQVYNILYTNPAIYDGTALFSANHKNLLKQGAAPSNDVIQKMILALGMQKDEFGEAITIRPATIVCGLGYGMAFYTIFNSATVQTTDNTQANNPLFQYRSQIQIVEEATLNALVGTGACPWFIVGDAMDTDFIEVDYLNGQEIPTIRRMETPGQLGFVWDIYLDWGVSVMDYRGAVKNPGTVIADPLA